MQSIEMTEKNELWYLEELDLYELLCPHKSPALMERHTFDYYQKDDYIYFPDDPSKHLYMISEGRVKIGSYIEDGKEIVKAILGKGEVFGELALAGEKKRKDFAKALDNKTKICPLTTDEMHEMMRDNKMLSIKIFKLLGFRIRKIERRLESLIFKDARTRIIEFLRELAEEKGQKVGFETMIKNHFTHKDIASLTGTSRQTVTTILNNLKEQNIINFDRRRILIRDMDKLN